MAFLWHEIFFQPLLNLLIGLYNTIGLENLGLAIIALTVLVRLLLLPFSFKDQARKAKQQLLETELAAIQRHYSNAPSVLRDEQKKLLKKYRIRRWPKIVNLAVQGFVLLILYQVFLGGIKLSTLVDELYAFVEVPRTMQTVLLGIDIAQPDFWMSLITGLILFAVIIFDHGGIRAKWSSADMLYAFGLPAATFGLLWMLPAVKALFVLTSLVFSIALRFIIAFFVGVREQDSLMAKNAEEKKSKLINSIPHPKERFK